MNWSIEILSKEKKKITVTRKEIAKWLMTNKSVFNVKEILQSSTMLDRVSVYRTIDLFTTLDIIHPVFVKEGEQYFEVHHPENHHHHVVCDGCGDSKCVPCTIVDNIIIKGFKKIHHTVTFSGMCQKCN